LIYYQLVDSFLQDKVSAPNCLLDNMIQAGSLGSQIETQAQ
jgi:hypothetical protein